MRIGMEHLKDFDELARCGRSYAVAEALKRIPMDGESMNNAGGSRDVLQYMVDLETQELPTNHQVPKAKS